ncbi:MAG: TolC family protein [Marinifilaceae bacterium]
MRTRKWIKRYGTTALLLYGSCFALQAQDSHQQVLQLEKIWELALENNQVLKVEEAGVQVAAQQIQVSKLNQLPTVNTSLNVAYLGDVNILDKDFSNTTTVAMPHFGNSFTLQAQQLLFKGYTVRKTIQLADLQYQLSQLQKEAAVQEIKLLVTGIYLDLFSLYNQQQVYTKNIELAKVRLKNTEAMHKQDLVTRDDIIRTRLMLADLQIAREQVENSIRILNHQLTTATGLEQSVTIVPDTTILQNKSELKHLNAYLNDAGDNNQELLLSKKKVQIAEKGLSITKSELSPSFSLFAANNLQRPLTSSTPVLDQYSNSWQVGAAVSFDISSVYKVNRKKELSRLRLIQSQEAVRAKEESVTVEVNSAFIKYNESIQQLQSFEENKILANENYRMIEKKYDHQLAPLLDLLHASNSKLAAELQFSNAEINILFAYYKLLKTTGLL